MTGYVLVMAALWLLADIASTWILKHRCWYCGVLYSHEPGCPCELAE